MYEKQLTVKTKEQSGDSPGLDSDVFWDLHVSRSAYKAAPSPDVWLLPVLRHSQGQRLRLPLVHRLSSHQRHQLQWELSHLLQVLGAVADADEAEGVDDPVAHGDALDDVEGHQRVPAPGDKGGVKVPQQGEAVVWSPTQDIGDQYQDQHHHCPPTPLQPLPDLLRLKTGNILKPQLSGDLDVADGHDHHRAQELQSEDEEKVGAVENLLVHGPDLGTERLGGLTVHMWIRRLRGHVGRRD